MFNRHRQYEVLIVRNHLDLIITGVNFCLENLHFWIGDFSPLQPAYKLVRFAGEHAPANDLNPTVALTFEMWL